MKANKIAADLREYHSRLGYKITELITDGMLDICDEVYLGTLQRVERDIEEILDGKYVRWEWN